jgi:predicted lysophospholipase L1 biosynthesis ABC-type transport system permease subunit
VVEVITGGVSQAQLAPLLSDQAVTIRDVGGGAVVESCSELARVVVLSCATSGLPEGFSAPVGLVDAELPITTLYVATDGTRAAQNRVRTQAANLVPNAIIHTQQDRLDVDAQYFGGIGHLLNVGWQFVLIVAACSLTVGMVAGVIERRRSFAVLRASGLRRGEFHQVVLLETVATMVVTTTVGVGVGLVSSYASALFDGTPWRPPGAGAFAMVGSGVLVALVLSAMALPLVDAATRHDTVRYE